MKKILILAVAAVLILSACGRKNTEPQTVSFTLESNPTTGFSWQVEQSKELFDVSIEYVPDETDEEISGAGGVEIITLTPLKAGQTDVTMTYMRPWEGGEQGNQLVYSFKVDRNLQVTVTDSYSMGTEEPIATPKPEIR